MSERHPPRATRAGRLADFFAIMYPPAIVIPATLAGFAAFWFLLQALGGVRPLEIGWRGAIAAITLVGFPLLLRVYDELKDVETDLRLGRAGDPLYRDRPVVTGHIRVSDLVFLRWAVTAVLVAANLALGPGLGLAAFAGLYLFGWLSFRWFFYPPMKENLLLAFVTHNPIAFALYAYGAAVFSETYGAGRLGGWTVAALFAFWLAAAAWETSRKIRAPEEETDYRTYSKVLGPRLAAALTALFVAAAAGCHLFLLSRLGAGPAYPIALLAAAAIPIGACVLFIARPSPKLSRLRPPVELFFALVTAALAIALPIAYGLGF